MEMMLILPWLLGSGVTTAAIGDEDSAVEDDRLVQDVLPDADADPEVTGDFIQEYISAETVPSVEDDGETVVAWQDVVIGFASDDDLSGSAGSDLVDDTSADDSFWDRLEAATENGAAELAGTIADDLDVLFEDIEEAVAAPAAEILGVADMASFDNVAEIVAPLKTVTETVAPLLTEVFETAAEDAVVALQDDSEETLGQLEDAAPTIAEAGDDAEETLEAVETVATEELSDTLNILYDTFDGNPFEDAQTTAALAADIANEAAANASTLVQTEIASAIASGDAQAIEIIQDFVAGEDAILVEYAGAAEPMISIEDDGAGNARIVVDGRQVAVVAAAAAMVTQNDIQAVRIDIDGDRA